MLWLVDDPVEEEHADLYVRHVIAARVLGDVGIADLSEDKRDRAHATVSVYEGHVYRTARRGLDGASWSIVRD